MCVVVCRLLLVYMYVYYVCVYLFIVCCFTDESSQCGFVSCFALSQTGMSLLGLLPTVHMLSCIILSPFWQIYLSPHVICSYRYNANIDSVFCSDNQCLVYMPLCAFRHSVTRSQGSIPRTVVTVVVVVAVVIIVVAKIDQYDDGGYQSHELWGNSCRHIGIHTSHRCVVHPINRLVIFICLYATSLSSVSSVISYTGHMLCRVSLASMRFIIICL